MHSLLVLLLLAPGVALAQYKCTGPGGSVSFQQTPCAASQSQQTLTLKVAPAPMRAQASSDAVGNAGASTGGTVEQRMARQLEKERRVRELEQAVGQTEFNMANRSSQMTNEMAALRSRKQSANNNLAGATLEQSISTEMQAVASKYKAMNDVDIEFLKQLRTELAAAKQQLSAR